MELLDLTSAKWRKSKRSQAQTNCVEVAKVGGVRAIQDSKNPHKSGGAVLVVSPDAFSAFTAGVCAGEFD
jgi:hypothetical protein